MSPRITVFRIKLVHTLIFWVLSGCVIYIVFSGLADRITIWSWIAAGLLLVESVILALFRWTCPLTILAERHGAERGSVTDLFLPKWMADRIFPVCGTTYVLGMIIIVWRLLG